MASGDTLPISVSAERITLAWDPPPGRHPVPAMAIGSYRIYVAAHNSGAWRWLGEAPASEHPQYSVEHDDVGDGFFDFAVSAVNQLGQESDRHSSLDFTASPVGGWYIRWYLSR